MDLKQNPTEGLAEARVTDPTVQSILDKVFREKAPLTSALIQAGLVTQLDGVAKIFLEVQELPENPKTQIINGLECPIYEHRLIPLPFTYGLLGKTAETNMHGDMSDKPWKGVSDIHDLDAIRETAEKVAAAVEEQVKSVFANCRVVVGLPLGLFNLPVHGGPRVITIMNAYTAPAKGKYQFEYGGRV